MATNVAASTSNQTSILLVDDDRLILSTTSAGLRSAGYLVNTAESVAEAEAWLDQNERPDLVILDVRMPQKNGTELIQKLNDMSHIPFILLTAFSEAEIIEQVSSQNAMGYLVKPVEMRQMIPAIETAISRAKELRALRDAKKNLQTALDSDRAISVAVGIVMCHHHLNHDEAFDRLRRAARSNHLKLAEVAFTVVNASEQLNLFINKRPANTQ